MAGIGRNETGGGAQEVLKRSPPIDRRGSQILFGAPVPKTATFFRFPIYTTCQWARWGPILYRGAGAVFPLRKRPA